MNNPKQLSKYALLPTIGFGLGWLVSTHQHEHLASEVSEVTECSSASQVELRTCLGELLHQEEDLTALLNTSNDCVEAQITCINEQVDLLTEQGESIVRETQLLDELIDKNVELSDLSLEYTQCLEQAVTTLEALNALQTSEYTCLAQAEIPAETPIQIGDMCMLTVEGFSHLSNRQKRRLNRWTSSE